MTSAPRPPGADGAEAAAEAFLPAADRKGTALCLSGGGYRAALFHLGVLRRLDELGALARVDTISSVSGGSILSGFLANNVRDWPASGAIPPFAGHVVPALREFTRKNIRTLWFAKRLLPWELGDSSVAVESLVSRYRKDVVQLHLGDLPARPRFVFCASDLTFGTNWIAERTRVGSYMPGYVSPPPPAWSVARAVAASSCFPPVFEPMEVGVPPSEFKGGRLRADAPDRDELLNRLRLTDGGVYDNMALEPVWKDHAVLLVSDGGATFDPRSQASILRPIKHLGRYLAVQGRQAGAVRKRWLIASFLRKDIRGIYVGIGSRVARFDPAAPGYDARLVEDVIAQVRTDLDYFTDAEAAVLQNHGYLLADAAMRVHGDPDWQDPGPRAPLQVPYPEWMDRDKVAHAMRRSEKRVPIVGRWRAVAGTVAPLRRAWDRLRRKGR